MKKQTSLAILSAGLISLGLISTAQASLIGQTITCSNSVLGPDPSYECGSATAVVGSGLEFNLTNGFGQTLSVDVEDSSISIMASSFAQAIRKITLGDLVWSNDPLAEITGINNLLMSGISENVPVITIMANAITVDFGNETHFAAGGFISFDLVTSHSVVPVPAAVWLFGSGLLGLIAVVRRKSANI